VAIIKIVSLDVASKITGWSFIIDGKVRSCGLIKTDLKADLPFRLSEFRSRLGSLLLDKKPTHVVIENSFAKVNIKVLKILSQFAGVANECCKTLVRVSPYTMSNTTPKSYFKVKKKEELFEVIVQFFGLDDWEYKECNDMTDAIAQGICYYDTVLLKNKIRIEKPYGYIFNLQEIKKHG
jgi:Holliday junction resolvasome RuvABC endonuclease subunit